jgi:orotidine-5'-phosphate decarboxylase
MTNFKDRVRELVTEKASVLCIGLDAALPRQRALNVVPEAYFVDADDNEGRLNFSLNIMSQTALFAVAIKVNEQYMRGLTAIQHRRLTEFAHQHKLVAIYDSKLGDIRDSVESALFHYHEWGYDGITFNPLAGNLKEVVQIARKFEPPIGILVLTLMSNPEAEKYMRHAVVDGKPMFMVVAEEVRECEADGCIVAATGHVTEEDIKAIRRVVGSDRILLVPGVGTQKGNPEKVLRAVGRNTLIVIARDVIYSDNPGNRALEYSRSLRPLAQL